MRRAAGPHIAVGRYAGMSSTGEASDVHAQRIAGLMLNRTLLAQQVTLETVRDGSQGESDALRFGTASPCCGDRRLPGLIVGRSSPKESPRSARGHQRRQLASTSFGYCTVRYMAAVTAMPVISASTL